MKISLRQDAIIISGRGGIRYPLTKPRTNKIHKTQENWEEWRKPNEKKNTEQEQLEHSKPDKTSPITKLKIKLKQLTLKEAFNKTPTQAYPSTPPPPPKTPQNQLQNQIITPRIQSSNPKAITDLNTSRQLHGVFKDSMPAVSSSNPSEMSSSGLSFFFLVNISKPPSSVFSS